MNWEKNIYKFSFLTCSNRLMAWLYTSVAAIPFAFYSHGNCSCQKMKILNNSSFDSFIYSRR